MYATKLEAKLYTTKAIDTKTIKIRKLLGGKRRKSAEPTDSHNQDGVFLSAIPVVAKETKEVDLASARFLASIFPSRRKLLNLRFNKGIRKFSWSQDHSGTVDLAEP